METSLRLLSQGADPNYFHPEKNSTPLSVAAKAGQVCQVELLLVYGADPAAIDLLGKNAAEHAKSGGYHGLATRLNNAGYELSDRLSYFLCGKRPDHNSHNHYFIPELPTEASKIARKKMTGLNNKVFEELAIDVYDEVDRRETDALWSKLEANAQNSIVIPFLPVNPDYSATRNQGRQKLARLTHTEFASLSIDVLKEIKRRQQEIDASRGFVQVKYSPSAELNQTLQKLNLARTLGTSIVRGSALSDDEPLYDSVASDDDYYNIDEKEDKIGKRLTQFKDLGSPENASQTSQITNSTLQRSKSLAAADRDPSQAVEFAILKEQLESSDKKVQALIASNDDMRSELSKLQFTVQKLVNDNKTLQRVSMSPSHGANINNESPQHSTHMLLRGEGVPYVDGRSGSPHTSHASPLRSPQSPGSRAQSMYEYRLGFNYYLLVNIHTQKKKQCITNRKIYITYQSVGVLKFLAFLNRLMCTVAS